MLSMSDWILATALSLVVDMETYPDECEIPWEIDEHAEEIMYFLVKVFRKVFLMPDMVDITIKCAMNQALLKRLQENILFI